MDLPGKYFPDLEGALNTVVVDLNDEVGRPVALSASVGADSDLKLRLVEWRMLSM